MCKFKAGDRVLRLYNLVGRLATLCAGRHYYVESCSDGKVRLVGVSGEYSPEAFELVEPVYPNPPHPHAEVIKAWADGAQVQLYCLTDKLWFDITKPSFNHGHKYRIKPSKKLITEAQAWNKVANEGYTVARVKDEFEVCCE